MFDSDTFMKAFHHVLLEVRLRQRCLRRQAPCRSHGPPRCHAGARGRGRADLPRVWSSLHNQVRLRAASLAAAPKLSFTVFALANARLKLSPLLPCCSEGIPNMLLAEDEVAAR